MVTGRRVYIGENVEGVYALSDDGSIVSVRKFKGVESLDGLLRGKVPEELMEIVEEARAKGYDEFIVEDKELARGLKDVGYNAIAEFPSLGGEMLRSRPEEFLGQEWFRKYFEVGVELTRSRIQEQSGARDKMIIQAIEALDDIDRVINLLVSRLREWYGLHFPELDEIIPKHQRYAAFVKEIGRRENLTHERLEKLGFGEDKIRAILEARESMGAEVGKLDMEVIQRLAEEVDRLYKLRQIMEEYIDMAMDDVAPNLKSLVGAKLGARLISLAGGIRELAMLPSSTIQVLGAEKALFRHLRTGAKPPKHGVIFQYQAISRSPWWQRGKIARALAGKLAIAARVDYFSGEYIGEELKKELEARIDEIKKKYPNPPKRKPRKSEEGKRGRGSRGTGAERKEKRGKRGKGKRGKEEERKRRRKSKKDRRRKSHER